MFFPGWRLVASFCCRRFLCSFRLQAAANEAGVAHRRAADGKLSLQDGLDVALEVR